MPDSEQEALLDYDWPGNIRELRNIAERTVFLSQDGELRPSEILHLAKKQMALNHTHEADDTEPVKTIEAIEKEHIETVFKKFSANYTHTAKALGISLSTLRRKIKGYGIE